MALSPATDDDELIRAVCSAFVIGRTRTMQQDVTYGLRQTVDVTVKALSPGINDPTTAEDAIFHTAAILSELMRRDPPPEVVTADGRSVVMTRRPTHDDVVRIAFEEPRRAAADQPTVCRYLLDTLHELVESLEADCFAHRTTELRRQARLVTDGCGHPGPLPADIGAVQDAHARLFPDPTG